MLGSVRAIAVFVALLGLMTTGEQTMPVTYNQGIARIDNGWIVSGTDTPLKDTDAIARLDDNFKVVKEVKPAIPPRLKANGYLHVGDIPLRRAQPVGAAAAAEAVDDLAPHPGR
jgi:hypothetical protein